MKKLYDSELLPNLSEDIAKAKKDYNYQPGLTKKLDALVGDFAETTLLEIVLWKLNRYPTFTPGLIAGINDLRKDYTEEKARKLLRTLLNEPHKGFDLPMASTVLRFACPDHLQIIDQRVYRLITNEDKLKLSFNIDRKVDLYFEYLKMLKVVGDKYGINFKESDRILYQLDKMHNKQFTIHNKISDHQEE